MYIVASYTAAEDDFGIIYADLNSLSSPDKAFLGDKVGLWGQKNLSQTVCVKREMGFARHKFLNPLRKMIQFKKILCKINMVNYLSLVQVLCFSSSV